MAVRKRQSRLGQDGKSVLNAGTLVNVASIPLITAIISLIGFYYLTRDELGRHDVAISTTIPKEFKEEADAREKTRSEFLDRLQKLNDGVTSLSTNVAVQGEQNKEIAKTLGKISDQLQMAVAPRR